MTTNKNDGFSDNEIFDDSSLFDNLEKNIEEASNNNLNESVNKSLLNVSALCCDEEINGYDKLTGRTWIYPTNYPVRDYQFNIIKSAILKNTLVSLPTGLGKTFIAAVIMYNFYRWYPLGKIVFMAPTRPLVAQQIDACYNIIGIPPNDTIEMTGHMQVDTRKSHWQSKRVFFATPQVIYNDIKSGICPADKLRCLVIDEAHRARGNYAYCQIMLTLTELGHRTYRVLALSATPGSKVEDVINVVKNLHIAHLELRNENCIDVVAYSHTRNINTVVIQLGDELNHLKQQYVDILDGYARRLKQFNILPNSLGNLSKGRVVMLYKEYQTKDRSTRHPQHNYIMKDFTLLIALYHGLELLVKHGSRVFLNFFDEHPEKTWIQTDDKLMALLERLRDDLGVNPLALDTSSLPDGTIPELPKNLRFGHPKFHKLKEIMLEHFTRAKKNGQDTRAIVFCEYRESVSLVHCLLLQCRPLIIPQMFVGQGTAGKAGCAAVSQKQQLRVMRQFRAGEANTLVATSVAEEGLDVGAVDLIVCFDISTASPVRLVQRCGRTGRQRGGQVYILVTEGREHKTLMDCMRQKDSLNTKILNSREVKNSLYNLNPRMLPHDFTPECQKMYIAVEKKGNPKENSKKGRSENLKKGQKDLRKMLLEKTSSSSSNSSFKDVESSNRITETEFNDIFPDGYKETSYLRNIREYCCMNKDKLKDLDNKEGELNLSTWLEWQRTLQKTVNIGPSKDSEILTELLQYSDAKRFELPPSTQNPCFNTQDFATQITRFSPIKPKDSRKKEKLNVKSPRKTFKKSPSKKDGDIRALFSTATKSTKNYTKLINDLGLHTDDNIPTRLLNLLVDLNLEKTNIKICHICKALNDCKFLDNIKNYKKKRSNLPTFLNEPKMLDVDLIDDINLNSILLYNKHDTPQMSTANITKHMESIDIDSSKNFDLDFDFDSLVDRNSSLEMEADTENKRASPLNKNFDLGDVEDIFTVSSPEETMDKNRPDEKDQKCDNPKKILGFFGLDSIDDIFADSDDDIIDKSSNINTNKGEDKEDEITSECPLSPSILSSKRNDVHTATSPILCSQVRKLQLSTKKQTKPNISASESNIKYQLNECNNNVSKINSEISKSNKTNTLQITNDKSMLSITQLVEMINKTDNTHIYLADNKSVPRKDSINEERSHSPIISTQTDRKTSLQLSSSNKCQLSLQKKNESLIILDSDSDSNLDNTEEYAVDNIGSKSPIFNKTLTKTENQDTNIKKHDAPQNSKNEAINLSHVTGKRKFEDDPITSSPYFNKKQKTTDCVKNRVTLQEKVLAALNREKSKGDCMQINYMTSSISPLIFSQKENKNPQFLETDNHNYSSNDNQYTGMKNIELLQIFRKGNKITSPKKKLESILNSNSLKISQKRTITFNDSDDDFDLNVKSNVKSDKNSKHVAKKRRKPNEFLDLEAELSGDDNNSGDELSDDSEGSINDFICDENITHHEDIHAQYLRSIKSPVKGMFKIPDLPKGFNKEDILSQFVEEDTYEMDSFCVDSNTGLTQIDEISDLERAEIALNSKRRTKKSRNRENEAQCNGDSPIVKRNARNVKRQIQSDSDEDGSA